MSDEPRVEPPVEPPLEPEPEPVVVPEPAPAAVVPAPEPAIVLVPFGGSPPARFPWWLAVAAAFVGCLLALVWFGAGCSHSAADCLEDRSR